MAANPKHAKFIRYLCEGMARPDAYMKAYDITDGDKRSYASKAAHRLLMNNDEFRKVLRERIDAGLDEAQQILEIEATKSAQCLVKLRKSGSKDDTVRLRAAQDILDRAGLKPVEKTEIMGGLDITVELPGDVTIDDV